MNNIHIQTRSLSCGDQALFFARLGVGVPFLLMFSLAYATGYDLSLARRVNEDKHDSTISLADDLPS